MDQKVRGMGLNPNLIVRPIKDGSFQPPCSVISEAQVDPHIGLDYRIVLF